MRTALMLERRARRRPVVVAAIAVLGLTYVNRVRFGGEDPKSAG